MVTKFEIEKYCNSYEELYALVRTLETNNISDTDVETLRNEINKCCDYLSMFITGNTQCQSLSEAEIQSYGILAKEMEEIKEFSSEMHINANELVYFLVCAKLPHYFTKVSKSMKRSFVESAISLYYIHRFYLLSCVSKLFELFISVDPTCTNKSNRDQLIQDLVETMRRQSIVQTLANILNQNITSLLRCNHPIVSTILDESLLILRSFFFLFSFSIINDNEFQIIAKLSKEANLKHNTTFCNSTDKVVQTDAIKTIQAHIDIVDIACIIRQSQIKTQQPFNSNHVFRNLEKLKSLNVDKYCKVLRFALAIYGLQQKEATGDESREFRKIIRRSLQGGVFSILFRDSVLINNHNNDPAFNHIIFLILYDFIQNYLLIQSSQWHTITSKQFCLYENGKKKFDDKEDGLENIVYFLQYILYQLHSIEIVLNGNSINDNIIGYFCTMISDRLRAEPYLFNTYIYLLAAIANTSTASADAVYNFIDKAPSEYVSWPIMVSCLNEVEKGLTNDNTQRGLIDNDVSGFIAILTLIVNVIQNSSSCPAIVSSLQVHTIETFIKLFHQSIHHVMKAKLCDVLTALAKNDEFAIIILRQIECGRILTMDHSSGLIYELEAIEKACQAYPLTTAFLELLIQLMKTLSPRVIINSPAFPAMINYVFNNVFLHSDERYLLDSRTGEKWYMNRLCCEWLTSIVQLSTNIHDNETILKERVMAVIADILSGNDVLKKIMSIPSVDIHHTIIQVSSLLTDCVSDNSIYTDFRYFDSYYNQIELIHYDMILICQLMNITSEMIARWNLRSTTSSVITSLSSQYISNGHMLISVLYHITNARQPLIQYTALQILQSLANQINNELIVSLFDSFAQESMAIKNAMNELFINTLFIQQPDNFNVLTALLDNITELQQGTLRTECCSILLDILIAHAHCTYPSIITSLCSLPQACSMSHHRGTIHTILATFVTFLEHPNLIQYHPILAGKITHFIYILCCHHEKIILPELCSLLLSREVFTTIVSSFPYLLASCSSNSSSYQLGIYTTIAYSLKTLCILLHHQKMLSLSLQLIGNQMSALLQYNKDVCQYFETSNEEKTTSPLLDTMYFIDRELIEPSNMPAYLNMCTEGCWIQRENDNNKYMQVDLMQLSKNIMEFGREHGNSNEVCTNVMIEGCTWCKEWNIYMEMKVLQCMTINASNDILFEILIQNKEAIVLLPQYSSSPYSLHVNIIQALLHLMNHSTTIDRPYLISTATLLVDIMDCLQTSVYQITPFMLDSLLSQLLEVINSASIQQHQNTTMSIVRGYLYLTMTSFIYYSYQKNSITFITQPLQMSLSLLSSSLLQDCTSPNLQTRCSALALLTILYHTEVHTNLDTILLAHDDVMKYLIHLFDSVTIEILNNQQCFKQQCEVVRHTLAVLISFASHSAGAVTLLDMSILPVLAHCPLLSLNCPANYAMYPSKLTLYQRNTLRLLLKPMFELVLTLNDSVMRFRNIKDDIMMFIRSTMNVSLILIEDREPDEQIARDAFVLYEAVFMLIIDEKGNVSDDLQGLKQAMFAKRDEVKKWKEDKRKAMESK